MKFSRNNDEGSSNIVGAISLFISCNTRSHGERKETSSKSEFESKYYGISYASILLTFNYYVWCEHTYILRLAQSDVD